MALGRSCRTLLVLIFAVNGHACGGKGNAPFSLQRRLVKGIRAMKHIKSVSKSTPAKASILTWYGSVKAAFGSYASILFGQFDNRTANAYDDDFTVF